MTPADIVITRFGGVRALARHLKKDPSTVHRWKQPKEKGGLDGRVPSAVQPQLLVLAAQLGVVISPSDLVAASGGSAVSYVEAGESTGGEVAGAA